MTRPTRARRPAPSKPIEDAEESKADPILNLDDYNSEEDDDFDPDEAGSADEDDHDLESNSGDEGRENEEEAGNEVGQEEEVEGEWEDEDEGEEGEEGEEEELIEDKRRQGGKGKDKGKGSTEQKGKTKKKDQTEAKAGDDKEDEDEDDDDQPEDEDFGSGSGSEGGEGGQVKTRAQRARQEKEKIPLATMATATADVNSLWETMNKPSWKKTPLRTSSENAESRISPTAEATSANDTTKQSLSSEPTPAPAPASTDNGTANATSISTFSSTGPSRPETIMKDGIPHINISHTYEFAGEIHTTNKLVPLDSAEAKLYLSSLSNSSPTANGGGAATENGDDKSADPPKRRPLKRTSAFDVPAASKKPNKLNTLEKSKLDWAGFVDQEGIKEDLERAGKGGGYLDRQAFLGRVEERREGVWREGRGGRR